MTASGRRRCPRGRRLRWPPRIGCASCTATSRRTSCAASTPARVLGQYMGRAGGVTGGRDGNVHFGDRTLGCVGMVSMLPDMMLVATGMAMAFKLRGERALRAHLVRRRLDLARRLARGDELGGRPAAPRDLRPGEQPVRLLDPARPAVRRRPRRARRGLRLPRVQVDGNDVEAVFEATRAARERALAGDGPTLIEAVTMRMHGHAAHDDMRYVPKEHGRGVGAQGPDRAPGAPAASSVWPPEPAAWRWSRPGRCRRRGGRRRSSPVCRRRFPAAPAGSRPSRHC